MRSGTLKPGDVLRLRIWREPDLSGEFAVDEAGVVILPKLGRLLVSTLTPAELEVMLSHEYAVYLRNPSVEVTALRRVSVLGAVRTSGVYLADPTMTLREVLALAGGVMPQGRADGVEIRRGSMRLRVPISGVVESGQARLLSGDEVYVPERSWISRNPAVLAAAMSAAAGLMIALLRD